MTHLRSAFFLIVVTFVLASCSNEPGTKSSSRVGLESESTQVTTLPTEDVPVDLPIVDADSSNELTKFKEAHHAAIDPVLKVLNVSEYPASLNAVGWNDLRKAHKMVGDIDETQLQLAASTLKAKYDAADMAAGRQLHSDIARLQIDILEYELTQLKEDFSIEPLDSLDQYLLPRKSALQKKRQDLGDLATHRAMSLVERELTQRRFLLNVGLDKNDTPLPVNHVAAARSESLLRSMNHIIHQAFFREYLHSLTPCETVILFRPSDYPKIAAKLTENGGAPGRWYYASYRSPECTSSAHIVPYYRFVPEYQQYKKQGIREKRTKISDGLYHEVATNMYKAFVLPLLKDPELSKEYFELFDFLPSVPEFAHDAEIQAVFQGHALFAGVADISSTGNPGAAPQAGLHAAHFQMMGQSAGSTAWSLPVSVTLSGEIDAHKQLPLLLADMMYVAGNVGIGWLFGVSNNGYGIQDHGQQIENSFKLSYFTKVMRFNCAVGSMQLHNVHNTTMQGVRYHADLVANTKFVMPFIQLVHRQFSYSQDTTASAGLQVDLLNTVAGSHNFNANAQFKVGYHSAQQYVASVNLQAKLDLNEGISLSTNASFGANVLPSFGVKVELQQ